METRKTQLDVDFIGDQVSLTSAEEKALSDYFEQRKREQKQSAKASKPTTKQNDKTNPARV